MHLTAPFGCAKNSTGHIFRFHAGDGQEKPFHAGAAVFGVGGQAPHDGFGELRVDFRATLADVDGGNLIVLEGGRSTRVSEPEVIAAARGSVARMAERLGLGTPGRWPRR